MAARPRARLVRAAATLAAAAVAVGLAVSKLPAPAFGYARGDGRDAALSAARQGAKGGEPVVVGNRLCPFAQRAWLCLEESGLDYTLKEAELYPKPAWLTALNPRGLVPFLVESDGQVTTESETILDVVAARAGGALADGGDAERASKWRRIVNNKLLPAGKKRKLFGGGDLDEVLRELDGLVAGPFVAGEAISNADISAAPMMQRLFEAGYVPDELTKLHAWYEALSARSAFQKTKLAKGNYWWWW